MWDVNEALAANQERTPLLRSVGNSGLAVLKGRDNLEIETDVKKMLVFRENERQSQVFHNSLIT